MASRRPFRAYSGDGKYIFASYCHADCERVYDELGRLFCAGYNLWYDQGIPNNSVLDRQISDAVKNCTAFIVFLSPASAASKYVTGIEIPLARKCGKKIFLVRLYDDDGGDYSDLCGRDDIIFCDRLADALPQSCRDVTQREPAPIEVDISNAITFDPDHLIGIEYYLDQDEAVFASFLNFGAINDVKEELTELCIPDHISGYPVRSIVGIDQHDEMYETERVIIPDTVTRIADGAFAHSSIPEIVLPPLIKRIPPECFADSNIAEVTLPYGIESIGREAFCYCSVLESAVIPETVASIGDFAFYDCTALEEIVIPEQVKHFGQSAFGNAEGHDGDLPVIVCTEGSPAQGYADENGFDVFIISREEMENYQRPLRQAHADALARISCRADDAASEDADISRIACVLVGRSDIGRISALLGKLRLDDIRFCPIVDPIAPLSGYAATVVILSAESCASGTIPGAISQEPDRVFPIMLDKDVPMPEQFADRFVLHSDDRTFDELYGELRDHLIRCGCAGDTRRLRVSQVDIGFSHRFEEDGIHIYQYNTGKSSVTVPAMWLDQPVSVIESYCFSHCDNLTDVTVQDGIREIESFAFNKCPSIKAITIPPSVTVFGNTILNDCGKVTIFAQKGSAAWKYAKAHRIRVKRI